MSLKEVLVSRFGPLMTYADMAALFGLGGAVAADAMRQRMRRCRVPDDWLLHNRRPLLLGREVLRAVMATFRSGSRSS
jgi:hypothetical protein